MTNAARHSGVNRILVQLELNATGGLRLEVRDGGGLPASAWQPGVGLISMRERAAELGGSCQAGPDPGSGGLVAALLPLGQGGARPADLSPGNDKELSVR